MSKDELEETLADNAKAFRILTGSYCTVLEKNREMKKQIAAMKEALEKISNQMTYDGKIAIEALKKIGVWD